ncbi:MAG: tetratricopeptide repeat protein [Myxococcales bacterium]|nr:tetratricopeptide repeat protein [Myxococcales bacterium]MCB9534237.1 tetratricopeptide repeat protein [Myxococcales bacterium]
MQRSPRALAGLLLLGLGVAGCDTSKVEALQRLSEGVQYAAAGENVEAARRLEESLRLDPTSAKANYMLGLIRLQRFQNPGEATRYLERAIELDAGDTEARYQLGIALAALGRPEEAMARFEEVIAQAPEHAGALFRLASSADEAGDVRRAIDLYTRAIYADPYFPLPYNGLGNIYFDYGRPQEALQVFQNGIDNCVLDTSEFRPGNAANRADLGRVYSELEEYDLAISYLTMAAELDSTAADIPFNLGVAYRDRAARTGSAEDRQAAEAQLNRARTQCNPAREQARCTSIAAALSDLRAAERPR